MEADNRSGGDRAWSQKVAELVIDAIIDAGLLTKDHFDQAVEITAEEILVRLALKDLPAV